MTYYASYKAIFDTIKTDLEAVTSIKQVVLGSPVKIMQPPIALINPAVTTIAQAILGATLENRLVFEVVLIVRETEPADWFDEIIAVMGDVVDAILADRTLNDTVKDTTPVLFAPGEVTFASKIYFGGLVRFEALFFFTRS